MNIFDQYGIKEVADVTLYSIHKKKDGSGDVYYVPALYLDTLKISSVEKTADNVWAEGGLGNARLISWDYGKKINVSLQDALCSPASLGMCWGGILSADWEDGHVRQDFGISFNRNKEVERISRMEKAFYPRANRDTGSISYLLPRIEEDNIDKKLGILLNSSVVDGTVISGFGFVVNRPYKWKMFLESDIQSVAVVPDRFYDINGKSHVIDVTHQLIVNDNLGINKFNIIYKINSRDSSLVPPVGNLIIDKSITTKAQNPETIPEDAKEQLENGVVSYDQNKATYNPPEASGETMDITNAEYLCIVIDQNDDYHAYVSKNGKVWYEPNIDIFVSQFKNIDMWLRFSSINEMIYFVLTKYENDISYIGSAVIEGGLDGDVTIEELTNAKGEGKLWSYINPKTMQPYPDDYWFHQGEPYYIKSLTIAPKHKKLKSQRITVTAGDFPGMYMLVGETYIRSRDTGEDERMQIKFPLCKIKSDQNITLEAGGDPTTFNLDVEVAKPVSGVMMEITSYEIADKMHIGENGAVEIKDGSTEVQSE